MGGVDLMDQLKSVCQLDRRSKFRFYLRLLFDLFDVALVNPFIVYKKLENKDLNLKGLRYALKLIASFISQKLSCLNHRPSKRAKAQKHGPIPPSHLPIFSETRQRCTVCSQEGKEDRTFSYLVIMWCSPLPLKRNKLDLQYRSKASSNPYS